MDKIVKYEKMYQSNKKATKTRNWKDRKNFKVQKSQNWMKKNCRAKT